MTWLAVLPVYLLVTSVEQAAGQGCTAPNLLPDKPFIVVWNEFTQACTYRGKDLGLEKWGIVENTANKWRGENMNIFYDRDIGKFPYFTASGTPVNGGLPQLANYTAHLEAVKQNVEKTIPDPGYSGLGVFDFETWRPAFGTDFGTKFTIYKTKSFELAKQQFPNYNSTQLWIEAKRAFEEGAKKLFEGALLQARAVRPYGRWGFYLFPRCWGAQKQHCQGGTTASVNDSLDYIYRASTALYPSIYHEWGPGIWYHLRETLRVKAKYSPHNATMLVYSRCQTSSYNVFDKNALEQMVAAPADMGAAGVVLWGSSDLMKAKNECDIMQDYVKNTLGPFVQNLTFFFGNCSQLLCHSHGRCVRKDYERVFQHQLSDSGRDECRISDTDLRMRGKSHSSIMSNHGHKQKQDFSTIMGSSGEDIDPSDTLEKGGFEDFQGYDFDDYVCKCYDGWQGIRCDQKT